jgi:hypothetical protein
MVRRFTFCLPDLTGQSRNFPVLSCFFLSKLARHIVYQPNRFIDPSASFQGNPLQITKNANFKL